MKRVKFFILGLFFFVAVSGSSWAANIGVETRGQGRLSLGVAIDVINQPLKLEKHPTVRETDISYDLSTGEITYINEESSDYFSPDPLVKIDWRDMRQNTNLAVCSISYEILKKLSVCGKLGIGDKAIRYTEYEEDKREDSESYGEIKVGYENLKQGFTWGGELAVVLYTNSHGLRLDGNAEYFHLSNTLNFSEGTNRYLITTLWIREEEWNKFETSHSQWQLSLILSQRIKNFVPYAGVGYVDGEIIWKFKTSLEEKDYDKDSGELIDWDREDIVYEAKFKPKENVSAIAGVAILLKENSSVNIEANFFAEQSITLGINLKL